MLDLEPLSCNNNGEREPDLEVIILGQVFSKSSEGFNEVTSRANCRRCQPKSRNSRTRPKDLACHSQRSLDRPLLQVVTSRDTVTLMCEFQRAVPSWLITGFLAVSNGWSVEHVLALHTRALSLAALKSRRVGPMSAPCT